MPETLHKSDLDISFGKRLRYLRQMKKMTQYELGDKVGLSRRQIGRIENGESSPQFSLLEKLCQAFDTNIIQLFLFQEESGSNQEKMTARVDTQNHISNNFLIQPSLIGLWSISNTTGEMSWTQGIYEFLGYSRYSVKPTLIRFLKRVDTRDKQLLINFFDTIHSPSHPQKILIRLATRKSGERTALVLKEPSRPEEDIQMVILDVTEVQEMHNQLLLNTEQLEKTVRINNIKLTRAVAELKHELHLRRQTEQRLRESEESFRTLAEKCPVSIFRFDRQGRVNFVNDWHINQFTSNKLEKKHFLNKSVHELPGLVKAGKDDEVARIFKGEYVEIDEVFFPEFAAGSSGWVSIRAVPIYKKGVVAGGILIRHNITDRKNLEKALQEKIRLLEAFLDNTPDVMSVKSPELSVVRYNNNGYTLLGLTKEQAIGKKCYELIGRETPCPGCACLEAINRKEPVVREKFIPEINIWFSCRANPVISDNGQVEYVVEIISDITERKRMEDSLRKSEERFSLAMEAAKDGLWDWDVQTGKVYYSPGYASMLGYETNKVPTHVNSWLDLIHPEDREKALQANVDCIENRVESFAIEFRMQARGGGWKWILGRGQAVYRDATGRALRMVGTHQDITEQKQAEKELRFQNVLMKTQMEVSQDGILIVDESFKIISFNQQFTDIWGIPDSIMSLRSGQMALEYVLDKLTEPDKFVKRIHDLYNNKQEKSYEE
ncbi:MAG: PAS domain S-box protein, partial [Desulfonatronovibrio sp.]